ncbi:MAG: Gfo/Idh/MocA family oxidoreductase [Pseudomonadota bacterium]
MKVGLIGTGMVAATHVAAIRGAGLQLAAVLGRDPARTARFAAEHGVDAVDDVSSVAQASDFVVLATPPDAREEIVRSLVAAGRPILSEKPLERDLGRAARLVQMCDAAGLPFGAVLQHRMRPATLALRERLSRIGRIASVELRVPWWRPESYYDVPGRGTYGRDGGGVLITQAIHALDLMLQFCGPVAEVRALTATTPLHRIEAEDFAAAALRFRSGAVGSVMASVTHRPGAAEMLVLNGTDGSAWLEGNQLVITDGDGASETIGTASATGAGADPMDFGHAWHQAVITDFAMALRAGHAPVITARSALPVQALIDAIQAAGRSGRAEEVPDV